MSRRYTPLDPDDMYHGRDSIWGSYDRSQAGVTTSFGTPLMAPPPDRRAAVNMPDPGRPSIPARRLPDSTLRSQEDRSTSARLPLENHNENPYAVSPLDHRPPTFAPSVGGLKDSLYSVARLQIGAQLDRTPFRSQSKEQEVKKPCVIPSRHHTPHTSTQPSIHPRNSFNLLAPAPETLSIRELLGKALLARTSSFAQREVRTAASTKPNDSLAGSPLMRADISTESVSSQRQPTALTPSSSSPSRSLSSYVADSPFGTLLEIAGGMPTTEFLDRLTNLHVDETPEERNASLHRYGEWMALSPETRMEIAGTSVDPKYCYGAVRVVGEWKWERGIDAEAKALREGNGKGASLADSDDEESDADEEVSMVRTGAADGPEEHVCTGQ